MASTKILSDDIPELPVKKTKSKKKDVSSTDNDTLGVFNPGYDDLLFEVERKFKLTQATTDVKARRESMVQTGLLTTDLALGGGIPLGGWLTSFGAEQSGKSTMCMTTALTLAAYNKIPVINYFDFENSLDPDYYESTLETITQGKVDLTDIFGIVNPETGECIKRPRIRVYSANNGDEFFDSMSSFIRNLPDLSYVDNKWWLVYENTVPNRAKVGDFYDKALFKEYNKFHVPAPNGGSPQAMFVLDSYSAMYPDSLDSDESDEKGSQGLASVARMFSENIPKLAAKLKKKGIIVLGVNQLRLRPMARGNPEYEPNGEAVKFISSIRVKHTSRVCPHGEGKSTEEEQSVTNPAGKDTYRYIVQKMAKNKTGGIPNSEVWQRIWVADAEGKGRGICPVWDAYQYLKLTGQVSGTMKKLTITLPNLTLEKISWLDFKKLILLSGKDLKEHCGSLGLDKNPKIREVCRQQLSEGDGYSRYMEHVRTTGKVED